MARRKEARYITFGAQDGFGGTGAINEATPAVSDTTMGVDTLSLSDSLLIVPKGARFTTAGIPTVRTVDATQNSQQFTLDMTGAGGGGTFDITVNGDTESGVAYNATAGTLQTALEALGAVGAGNITVTLATSVYTITFAGDLANIATNTLTVDGGSLTTPDGEVLTTVQTGLTTWSITFSPAIATGSVPSDDDVITWLPQRLVYKVPEDSAFEYTVNRDPIIDLSRGVLDGARSGTDQPMDLSAQFIFDWWRASSGDPITMAEVMLQEGDASTWVNAAPDPCEPYAIDLFIIDRPPCGSEQAEIMFFRQFYPQSINASVDDAVVSFSGLCVALKPESYRVANTDDAVGTQI